MINYKCPKCNSIMICVSTASIPPIITYQCYSCGYTSKPIKEEYNCEILPIELQGELDQALEDDAKQASIPYSYQMPKDYIKNKLDYLHQDSITKSDTQL